MMKLCVELIERPDYLEVVCSGDHEPEDWEELLGLILRESQRVGQKRVLVDVMKLTTVMENMTRYRVGLLVAEKLGPTYKIAALTPLEQINFFWETVAHNRGAQAKAGSDRETLVDWLCEPE